MMRPHDDDDDDVVVVERKRKVVRATAKWPKLVQCPTTRTPPPSQPLPILPDEIILEILLRLPVRSLVQFRSVCNSWRTLISSSQFAKYHLQRSMADPTLTHPRCVYFPLLSSSHKMGIFSIQSLLENPSATTKVVSFCRGRHRSVMGSCNGLLCLYDLDYGCNDPRAILWNPCTGLTCEWLEIEETDSIMSAHGFGYDHVHDKYKLFVVLDLISGGGSTAKIFTFGANYWRTIQDFPFNIIDPIGVFVNGTLNWVYSPEEEGSHWMLASLDLGKETYGQLSLPERDADDDLWFNPALGVLRNCLAVGLDHKKTHWGVWVMKEYGVHQSWTKLVMIPHGPLDHKHSFSSLQPLYISENDVLLARASSSKSPWSKLVLCNLNSGRLDFPMIDSSSDGMLESPISELVGARSLLIYHESLVSPSQCSLRNRLSRMPLIKPSV